MTKLLFDISRVRGYADSEESVRAVSLLLLLLFFLRDEKTGSNIDSTDEKVD